MKWNIIPPEIKNDSFYYFIIDLISNKEDINNILEIGASSGNGSTEALQIGKLEHSNRFNNQINLFSLEVCIERFDILKSRYKDDHYFYPYNVSSININEFPNKQDFIDFYNSVNTNLNTYPLDLVLSWYDSDIKYINVNKIQQDGIDMIKHNHNIENFDLVLIDGSEFTGFAEFNKIYGAKYILLDDINCFKNYKTHQYLKNDKNYNLIIENYYVRNGFSAFSKNIS
jgi:hypothetical protein